MKRLLLTAAIATASYSAQGDAAPPLSCVPANSCGCSILVDGGSCPAGGAHFFHQLADGAPLQFGGNQGPIMAVSARPPSNIFSPSPGESWTETYSYSGGTVVVHYTPGKSTCPKLSQGEACEYFDVNARVLLSSPHGSQRYSGVGTCGC